MSRVTLRDVRLSMLPQEAGLCSGDLPQIAAFTNRAQSILIGAAPETGWWGGWARIKLQATRCHPYITLPRQFARVINMDVCRFPIRINNEFYEFMEAGVGLQGFNERADWCGALAGYDRGNFPTMRDIDPSNQTLQAMITDPRDAGSRILISGNDQNGNPVYSQDGENSVLGFYMTFAMPVVSNGFIVTKIDSVQLDPIFGDVLLYQVDNTTGAQVLLSRFQPGETAPSYRRYYINQLPCGCFCHTKQSPCLQPLPLPTPIPITAMAKLDYIPANRDTDFLVVPGSPVGMEGLIAQCRAIRFSGMDAANSLSFKSAASSDAIKALNRELTHFMGVSRPALNFQPFGTAKLSRVMRTVWR